MSFGIGVNSYGADAGKIRRIQKEIACECWFTKNGTITPVMIKLEDEDGEIQTIKQIEVFSQEKKNYAGIPSIEFDCRVELQNRFRHIWLIYYQSENRRVINLRS